MAQAVSNNPRINKIPVLNFIYFAAAVIANVRIDSEVIRFIAYCMNKDR